MHAAPAPTSSQGLDLRVAERGASRHVTAVNCSRRFRGGKGLDRFTERRRDVGRSRRSRRLIEAREIDVPTMPRTC
jgi:hypothetical protein